MKAIWNGQVLAESNETKIVEGNHYFPIQSIKKDFFKPSAKNTTCAWKGEASYYTIEAGGEANNDAAWYYANPKDAARDIKDYVAFWKGVKVVA